MKKILGISLVAVLAVTPLMANATPVAGEPTNATPATSADAEPGFALIDAHDNDGNAASAGYVKGAYNAAIKAVNKVNANSISRDGNLSTLKTTQKENLVGAINEIYDTAAGAATSAGAAISKDNTGKISVDYTTTAGSQGLKLDGSGDSATLNVNVDNSTIAIGANGVQIKDGGVDTTQLKDGAVTTAKIGDKAVTTAKIGDKAVTAAQIADNTITTTQVATGSMATGTANNDKLTTKGYVDDAVTGLGNTYATKVGVDNTIKAVTLTQGAVTQGLTGSLASGTISIMTNWADDATKTDYTVVTGQGTLATNVSVAAPTIDANSVSYATANAPAPDDIGQSIGG